MPASSADGGWRLTTMPRAGGLTAMAWERAPSTLDPVGPDAASVATLWWVMLVAASAVFVLTMTFLFMALRRATRQPLTGRAPMGNAKFIALFGIALPVVVLVPLMVLNVRTGAAVHASPDPVTTVEVIGHQFWWEVRYPEEGAVTANEVRVPVGRPVRLLLTSDDVIHSFWVPQVAGKMDLIPGRVNELSFQVDQPGRYLGECAEFCGIQHARMRFAVIAEPEADYDDWVTTQAEEAAEPEGEVAVAGRDVFLSSSCVQCHAIRGVDERADVGPDLTHLASRATIGAGVLENNRGNLGGWILDPQALKPGVRMPPTSLDGDELQALLAYLSTLE